MKIRRYLGHDCNSHDGFNNGHYIDDTHIEARDYEHAVELCLEALKKRYEFTEFEDVSHGDGPCIEVITGYFDGHGNELTQAQYEALDGDALDEAGYHYVFVSAERE